MPRCGCSCRILSATAPEARHHGRQLYMWSRFGHVGPDSRSRHHRRRWTLQPHFASSSSWIRIDPKIQDALRHGQPVVALESTLIAHGMPYPENLGLLNSLLSILRGKSVEPAVVAVCNGMARVGLSDDEVQDLALAGSAAAKITTRQLPILLAQQRLHQHQQQHKQQQQNQWGATTVASTMVLAHRAGISTFVTGGIGGVHRNAETTMDISADLMELARTPVMVVSAGIKSILDIGKTLEVLETYGVPVIAYKTNEFPAFFSPHSGIMSPARMDKAHEIASAYLLSRRMGLTNGMLVAVPNEHAAGADVEEAIQAALTEADTMGLKGPALTPFLLKRVAEKTEGQSLQSNIALVQHNAQVGADIALALAELREPSPEESGSSSSTVTADVGNQDRITKSPSTSSGSILLGSRVIVLGGCVRDIIARTEKDLLLKTSNPASCTESDGGVARNVAEVLGRLGSKPLLYSAVGDDVSGLALLGRLSQQCHVVSPDLTVERVQGYSTATYLALLEADGDLHCACADMKVFERIRPPPMHVLSQAEILVMDANAPLDVVRGTARLAVELGVMVCWDPTSVPKAKELSRDDSFMSCLSLASPNVDELVAICGDKPKGGVGLSDDLSLVKELATGVLDRMRPGDAHLVITLGKNGVLLASKNPQMSEPACCHYPATPGIVVQNATGAGDSLLGALIHGVLMGKSMDEAVRLGMLAADLSLSCPDRAISPHLTSAAVL